MKLSVVFVGAIHAAWMALALAASDDAFPMARVTSADLTETTTPLATETTTPLATETPSPTSPTQETATPTETSSAPTTPAPVTPIEQCLASVIDKVMFQNDKLISCADETSYPFYNAPQPPTQAQLDAMCKSTACIDGVADALKEEPVECIMPLNKLLLRSEILDRIAVYCEDGEITTPAPTVAEPIPLPLFPIPGPAATPAPGPVPSFPTPVCSVETLAPVQTVTDELIQCATDASFAFLPLSRPSEATIAKMCASESCVKVITAALAANPTECTAPVGNIQYRAEFLDLIGSACEISSTTPAPTTTTPATTTPATTAPSTPDQVCELATLNKLLYENDEFVTCALDTEFPLLNFGAAPSKEQMDKFCTSETCSKAFADALEAGPTECRFPVTQLTLVGDFLDRVVSYCKTGVVPTTSPSLPPPAPQPTPAPTPVPAPGPVPSFPTPVCSVETLAPVQTVTDELIQCATDASFAFLPLSRPSEATIAKMCASESCVKVITAALAANPTECTAPVGNIQYRAEFLDLIGSACEISSTTPAPTTTTPATTTPATTAPSTPDQVCELATLNKLLYENDEFVTCALDTEFPLLNFGAAPSKEQMDKFCTSETCSKAFADALEAGPTECRFPVTQLTLVGDFLDRVVSYCKTGVVPTTSPSLPPPAPQPTPAPTPVPAPGPVPSFPTPVCSVETLAPVQTVTDELIQCATDASFAFLPLSRPSEATIAKMCASESCVKVITAALAANPTECTAPVGNIQYRAEFLDLIGSACEISSTTPAPTTTTPATTTPATTAPSTPDQVCELATLNKLLYENDEFVTCALDTEFPLLNFGAAPSKEQMDKFCTSETCSKAFADALEAGPTECRFPVTQLTLVGDFLDRVVSYCKTGVVPTTSPSLPPPAPQPTPAPTPVPAPGPVPSFPTPVCSVETLAPVQTVTDELIQCATDASFAFLPLSRPSEATIAKMCASESCVKVITAALAANPTECTAPVGNIQYRAEFLDLIGSACEISSTTPAPTTTTPATTTPATTAPSTPDQVCELATLNKLLYENDEFVTCALDTEFPLLNFGAAPSKEQMDKFCTSETCSKAFADALEAGPTECRFPVTQLTLVGDFLDRVVSYCKTGVVPTTSPSLPPPAPQPTPAPTPVPAPGPVPSFPTPVCSVETLAPVQTVTDELIQCATDASFAFLPLSRPSEATIAKMCASESCVKVITAALAANPTECTAPVGNIQYRAEFLDLIGSACEISSTTPAPTTTTPATTTPATTAPSTPDQVCELATLNKLLYENDEFVTCALDTEFPLLNFGAAPSKEQMDKFCTSETCSKAFADALEAGPTECRFPVTQLTLVGDFLDRVVSYCKTGVVPTTSPSLPPPAPQPTPAPTPVPAPGPVPSFPTPVCSVETLAPVQTVTDELIQCATDASFAFLPLSRPSEATIAKMCASESCVKVITAALAANPTECTAPVGNIQYRAEFLDLIGSACEISSTTPAPTTTTPATTTPATTAPSTPDQVCELATLNKLLYENDEFVTCALDTEFPLLNFGAAPSKEQMDKFCTSETCSKAFADALEAGPTECRFPVTQLTLVGDFLDRVVSYCKTGVVPTTSPSLPPPAPQPTPAPTPVPAPGPVPSFPTPVCSVETLAPVQTVTDELIQCATDASFAFLPLSRPSEATIAKMCASESCVKVITAALAANPTECTAPVGNIQYRAEFLDLIGSACEISSTTPAPTTTTPATTTPATTAPSTPEPTTPASTTPEPTTPAPITPTPTAPANGDCGNDKVGPSQCPQGQYCQPWNPSHYQCRSIDAKCGKQEVGIDYFGDDIASLSVLVPEQCCDKCRATTGCKAYTFVNFNADGRAMCYLKKGTGEKRAAPRAVSAVIDSSAPTCAAAGAQCGSDREGAACCPSGHHCQPWNPFYYQCIPSPPKCAAQEVGIDYFGEDLQTVYGLQPSGCCDRCAETAGCKAYTFVNYNRDGRTACYLKKGRGEKRKMVGAVSSTVITPKPPGCATPQWGSCGNELGATCCPSGFYCQPWNPHYYQCMATPAKCSEQLTDVDFLGNDIATVFGITPEQCCDRCAETAGCKAYTFVNANPGRPACYLKSSAAGRKTLSGAVSGIVN
nr:elicitin-like protein [Pythium porphyrae]